MSTTSDELEQYLLLLLSDSNLPTGGFISSSGLESYIQHGFLHSPSFDQNITKKEEGLINFIKSSLNNYGRINLGFVSTTWELVTSLHSPSSTSSSDAITREQQLETVELQLANLDNLFESMTLNEITRKASTSQGIALLTLYERAFSPSPSSPSTPSSSSGLSNGRDSDEFEQLIKRLKSNIRKGLQGGMKGHLPIGFGILTALLGLSLQSTQNLFLFLHARSILSSSVRLNIIGPYTSHRLLLHEVRQIVEVNLRECISLRVGEDGEGKGGEGRVSTTWPLGEILQGRHGVLHSRIFNS